MNQCLCFENERIRVGAEGTLIGSPAYSAPELLTGEGEPTRASDVYGLGAVAYEVITGNRPVEGEDLLELMVNAPKAKFAPLRGIQPKLAPITEDWILAMLSRSPDRRPKTLDAIGRDFSDQAKELREEGT